MSDLSIQELLDDYVHNQGKNVTTEKVEAFFNDPDPHKRRIALELMNGLTGDTAYLLKCVPLIKDDINVLWEFLNDYCSDITNSFAVSALIIEALKYINCAQYPDKSDTIINSWMTINPNKDVLPDDPEKASEYRDLLVISLPVIANVFINWIALGVKLPLFHGFNLIPYYLSNHANLKSKIPDHILNAIKDIPDKFVSNYDLGMLSVFQYDLKSANGYFIKAAESLIASSDLYNAYNVILMWYNYASPYINCSFELLANIEELLWKLCYEVYLSQNNNNQTLLMIFYLYCEVAFKLIGTDKFNYNRILELTRLYEKKILLYKNYLNINYNPTINQKDKINLGFMSFSLNTGSVGSVLINFIQNHNKDKFNIYYYDCGMAPDVTDLNLKLIEKHATVRRLISDPKTDKLQNAIKLAEQVHNDNIDVLVYMDWLINVVGHAVCCFKPAPVIVRVDLSGITTGLTSVPYMIDYFGIASKNEYEFTEKLIEMPLAFNQNNNFPKNKRKIDYGIPSDSILLYSFNIMERPDNKEFLNCVSEILLQNPSAHFAFSGRGNKNLVMEYFSSYNLMSRVHFLSFDTDKDINESFVSMSDIYLNPFPISSRMENYYAMFYSKPAVVLCLNDSGILSVNIAKEILGISECLAKTPKEYIDIVNDLVKSKEYRNQIGEKLKNRALTDFNINKFIEAHENFYIKLFNEF